MSELPQDNGGISADTAFALIGETLYQGVDFSPPDDAAIAAQLDRLAQVTGIDPAITDARKAVALDVFATGLEATDKGLQTVAAGDADTYSQTYTFLHGKILLGKLAKGSNTSHQQATVRQLRRHDSRALELDVEEHNMLTMSASLGLLRYPTTRQLFAAFGVLYHPESGRPDGFGIMRDVKEQDILTLFGAEPDGTPPVITEAQVAAKLRELSPPDLSKETLDARFYTLTRNIQLDVACTLLSDLFLFGKGNAARTRSAADFLRRHDDALRQDNLPAKMYVLNEFEEFLHIHGDATRGLESNENFALMGSIQRKVTRDIAVLMDIFATVYGNLGYDLPELLQPSVQEPTPQALVAPRASVEKEAMAAAKRQEAQAATEQAGTFTGKVAAFNEEWRLSSKKRRQRGLDGLRHKLAMGSGNGATELAGVEETADFITDVLAGLDAITQKQQPHDARQFLEATITSQHQLEDELQTLSALAVNGALKVADGLPKVPQFGQTLEYIAANWPAFKRLITETWPNRAGSQLAQRIEPLLFPPNEAD